MKWTFFFAFSSYIIVWYSFLCNAPTFFTQRSGKSNVFWKKQKNCFAQTTLVIWWQSRERGYGKNCRKCCRMLHNQKKNHFILQNKKKERNKNKKKTIPDSNNESKWEKKSTKLLCFLFEFFISEFCCLLLKCSCHFQFFFYFQFFLSVRSSCSILFRLSRHRRLTASICMYRLYILYKSYVPPPSSHNWILMFNFRNFPCNCFIFYRDFDSLKVYLRNPFLKT